MKHFLYFTIINARLLYQNYSILTYLYIYIEKGLKFYGYLLLQWNDELCPTQDGEDTPDCQAIVSRQVVNPRGFEPCLFIALLIGQNKNNILNIIFIIYLLKLQVFCHDKQGYCFSQSSVIMLKTQILASHGSFFLIQCLYLSYL